jgi:hypothetical protein
MASMITVTPLAMTGWEITVTVPNNIRNYTFADDNSASKYLLILGKQ